MIPPSDWESICSSSTSRNTTPAAAVGDQSPTHHTLDASSPLEDGREEGSLSLEPSITSNVVEEPKRIGELYTGNA